MYCGNSSVGRAQPCQGWGREFESRFPLKRRSSPNGLLFLFDTMTRPKRPHSPLPGVGGVNISSREIAHAQRGLESRFPLRVKTGVASKVKLLDIPLSILKKYESTRINGYLLPVLSNAKYNLYLKEIAATLGIPKRVTSHLARHTFATTVTYANGVSIESISKMLGHTKLATTQIYARIVDQTVSREMDKLSAALSGTSFSLNNGETSTQETPN